MKGTSRFEEVSLLGHRCLNLPNYLSWIPSSKMESRNILWPSSSSVSGQKENVTAAMAMDIP